MLTSSVKRIDLKMLYVDKAKSVMFDSLELSRDKQYSSVNET